MGRGENLQRIVVFALVGGALLTVSSCIFQRTAAPEGGPEMTIQLTSEAFVEGEAIPKKFTCDGESLSPALSWSGVPDGTKSLALIVDDPDAPAGNFVHWVYFNIESNLAGLPEGFSQTSEPESPGVQGRNSYGRVGYGPPCPPRGSRHRYFFTVYALDDSLDLSPGSSKADVERRMRGHILGSGKLMGIYAR